MPTSPSAVPRSGAGRTGRPCRPRRRPEQARSSATAACLPTVSSSGSAASPGNRSGRGRAARRAGGRPRPPPCATPPSPAARLPVRARAELPAAAGIPRETYRGAVILDARDRRAHTGARVAHLGRRASGRPLRRRLGEARLTDVTRARTVSPIADRFPLKRRFALARDHGRARRPACPRTARSSRARTHHRLTRRSPLTSDLLPPFAGVHGSRTPEQRCVAVRQSLAARDRDHGDAT